MKLVTSDAHAGLTAAVAATLPRAAWQRCRTHCAANLMSTTPESSWVWVKALLHSVYDQADAASVHAQFDRVGAVLAEQHDEWAEGRRYLGLDVLARAQALGTTTEEVTAE